MQAGCDIAPPSNGAIAEMQAVASAVGKLKGRAKARAEAAMARVVRSPEPLDASAAHARFHQAMAGRTDAAQGPDVGEAQ